MKELEVEVKEKSITTPITYIAQQQPNSCLTEAYRFRAVHKTVHSILGSDALQTPQQEPVMSKWGESSPFDVLRLVTNSLWTYSTPGN